MEGAQVAVSSFSTYLFQSRTASRAEAFTRDERLRQEQLTSCSAYAGSLTELKRALISLWLHREEPDGPAWKRHAPNATSWVRARKLPGSACSSYRAIPG